MDCSCFEGAKKLGGGGPPLVRQVSNRCNFESPADLKAKGNIVLPAGLDEVTADFMERVLQYKAVIPKTCKVVSITKKDVGMTAGYFSSIAKVECTYSQKTDALKNFIVKA